MSPKNVLSVNKDPPCMPDGIKTAIRMKNDAYKQYLRSGRRQDHNAYLNNLKLNFRTCSIMNTKSECHRKLRARLILLPMQHASQFRTFANDTKIPVIRPLLIDGYFISDFQAKACHFNKLFGQYRTTVSTENPLPSNETVTTVNFVEKLISKLSLDSSPGEARVYDGISMRLLESSFDFISAPQSLIFRNCLSTDACPFVLRKG